MEQIKARVVQALAWQCVRCNAHCIIEMGLVNIPFTFVCPDKHCRKRYVVNPADPSVRVEESTRQDYLDEVKRWLNIEREGEE